MDLVRRQRCPSREFVDDGFSNGANKDLEAVLVQEQILDEDKSGTTCLPLDGTDKLGQIVSSARCVEEKACFQRGEALFNQRFNRVCDNI